MALYFRYSLWEARDRMRSKNIPINRAEAFYVSVIKKKTAREKLKMLDGLFRCAKAINPRFFKCPKNLKVRQTS